MTMLPFRKKRVLIADDVHETRRNTRVMLSMIDGIEVVAIAMNGKQAIEMAREHKPDIVMLDINMPEMNGLMAFKKISQENPNVACIIISAERDPSAFRAAMSLGITNYLLKPFNADELEKAVHDVFEQLEKKRAASAPSGMSESDLRHTADELTKSKRTDDSAIETLETAIQLNNPDIRWMQTLAMMYVVRQKWGKLKVLAEKIEQHT